MRPMRVVIHAIILAALLLGAGACNIQMGNWSQAHYERQVDLQHAMADGGVLTVSTASGSIDVDGQAVSEARIVATIRGQAPTEEEARQLAEETEIRIETSGDRVAIKADTPRQGNGRSVSISYDIVVPTRTSVECENSSGGVEVMGLEGSVRGHTASGSVAGENLRNGSVNLHSSSGSVRLTNAIDIASCEMHTSSGRASAEQVQAESIRIGSTSGSVELRDARAGTIDMRGTSGRVEGRDLNCSRLNAESASGGVSIEFSPAAPADVTATIGSISGGVSVVAPRDFAGRIEMYTTSGSVRSDLPVTVQGKMSNKHLSGTVGSGSGSLSLRTTSGSVNVR